MALLVLRFYAFLFWGCVPAWVGEPIKVVQDSNPSEARVQELYTTYLQAVQDLYDRHKEEEAVGDRKLVIF